MTNVTFLTLRASNRSGWSNNTGKVESIGLHIRSEREIMVLNPELWMWSVWIRTTDSASYLHSALWACPSAVRLQADACAEPADGCSLGSGGEYLEGHWREKNVLITNIYMHAHTYTQGYIWDESGMSPNKQRKALWIRYSTAGVQAQWQSFFHWSSNPSCVCVRLLADFSLTTSLGCRLAWSICWKTPLGAERRGDTLINIT